MPAHFVSLHDNNSVFSFLSGCLSYWIILKWYACSSSIYDSLCKGNKQSVFHLLHRCFWLFRTSSFVTFNNIPVVYSFLNGRLHRRFLDPELRHKLFRWHVFMDSVLKYVRKINTRYTTVFRFILLVNTNHFQVRHSKTKNSDWAKRRMFWVNDMIPQAHAPRRPTLKCARTSMASLCFFITFNYIMTISLVFVGENQGSRVS